MTMEVISTDWIAKWADYRPNKVAIKDLQMGNSLSYAEMNNAANYLASYFQDILQLKKGDRVAILSDFNLTYVLLFSVAQKLGIILLPLNFRLSGRELDYLLENSETNTCIFSNKYLPLIEHEKQFCACKHQLDINQLEKTWVAGIQQGEHQFESMAFSLDHPLFILYTSGTTGLPKGALYTHKMAFWNSINTGLRLAITEEDRTIVCMPPFHTGGWNVLLSPFLHHGSTVCLLPKFDASTVMEHLEKEQITLFMAVPTMLKMMADSDHFNGANLSHLRYFIVGGEPMPIPLIEKWHDKGIPIRQGFGMTEAGPNLTSLDHADAIRKKGSIGIPNFYVETKLVDEMGKEVDKNEIGELLIKGPIVTLGYWKNEEATSKAFQNGWFRTGDLMKRDEEGYLYVMDRIKNMFISGGENVYPAELEHFLRSHEAITEVAVIGIPHPKWGEVGQAFIVAKDGEKLSAEAIKQFCNGRLARYKTPKSYVFLKELPKSATGKIDKKRLKEFATTLRTVNKESWIG